MRLELTRFRGISDKVDSLGRPCLTKDVLPPLLQHAGSILEGANLRLAERRDVLRLLARPLLKQGFDHDPQGAHSKPCQLMVGRPHDIVVGKVQWGTVLERVRYGVDASLLAHQQIHDDLSIIAPMPRVGKDKDGVDIDVIEIAVPRVAVLFIGEGTEGSDGGFPLHDIAGSNDVLETVAFSNGTAFLAFTADYKDRIVFIGL